MYVAAYLETNKVEAKAIRGPCRDRTDGQTECLGRLGVSGITVENLVNEAISRHWDDRIKLVEEKLLNDLLDMVPVGRNYV